MKTWQRPNFPLISRMMLVLIGIMALDAAFLVFIHHELQWAWWVEAAVGLILAAVMLMGGTLLSPRLFMDRATRPAEGEWQARVERIAFLADVASPELFTIGSPVANAFTVRSWTTRHAYAIVVTDTLLATVTPEEFDAVVAHEIAHIAHHDVVMILLAGSLSLMLSAMLQRWWILGSISSSRGSSSNPLGMVVMGIMLTWLLSTLMLRMFSRYRELAADRTASLLLGSPYALMGALRSCDEVNQYYARTAMPSGRRSQPLRRDLRAVEAAQMLGFTWNGVTKWSVLSTHPSTQQRIHELEKEWQ